MRTLRRRKRRAAPGWTSLEKGERLQLAIAAREDLDKEGHLSLEGRPPLPGRPGTPLRPGERTTLIAERAVKMYDALQKLMEDRPEPSGKGLRRLAGTGTGGEHWCPSVHRYSPGEGGWNCDICWSAAKSSISSEVRLASPSQKGRKARRRRS